MPKWRVEDTITFRRVWEVEAATEDEAIDLIANGEWQEPISEEQIDNTPYSALAAYRVTLHEEAGDKHTIVFDCYAEDPDHAAEQAMNAYPAGEILNCTTKDSDA